MTSQVVSRSLSTAAGSDPDPTGISQGLLAVSGLIASLFSFGYNPQKLNDTQITEAVQIALHQLWCQLTGEDLGGGQCGGCTCTPGKCGGVCAIFTTSAYPNVPYGAEGNTNVDVTQTILQAQQIIQQGQSKLQRPESLSDYQANVNYMMSLFNQVLNARATSDNPITAIETAVSTGSFSSINWSGILPWLIGGYAVLQLV